MITVATKQPTSATCRRLRRVTWTGLAVNLALSALKGVAGIVGSSQAVLTDAVHSLTDGVSDVAILLGVGSWSEPADTRHPYGHGRIETLITVLIGTILAATGVGMAWRSISSIFADHIVPTPTWPAFVAALISLIVKEALFRWHRAVGRRERSEALMANAWHHRSDAISSLPAMLAVGLAMLSPGWNYIDAVGAFLVSLIILWAAMRIVVPALNILIDRAGTAAQLAAVERLTRAVEGVRDIHALRSRQLGHGLSVDLHVLVDGNLSVRHGHDIATEVKNHLLEQGPEITDVVVHLEPYPAVPHAGNDIAQENTLLEQTDG